ncbi:TetR/AcrR family transcriptional regulator [Knoellia subterranea]|uniref:TetR family transcriptional regulator n=1 Tax=Knoellia subterranea KCTC 19937 TaxID=1385521 RepID=A0A0A0JMZ5_9MICO|nr:TetR/AcrR family transcriptional regulator [Knoellia subterranea]KGN38109.1 TetR family transcriptional regulator [Knoellia subterranea KCTC 19937]
MTPRAPAMTRDARRASIIAVTMPLLREKGRVVSTKEIAAAAGVAEGTIFKVFDNKDELIEATIQDAFDNTTVLTELEDIDRDLPLRDRLSAAVAIMQDHLRGMFALMTVLQASGKPMQPPRHDSEAHRRREESTARLDEAFVDLIGDDVAQLRVGATRFIGYLRMLTLSSVHPILGGEFSTPEELVEVLLDGALDRNNTHSTTNRRKK